jgi:hypothetical protein
MHHLHRAVAAGSTYSVTGDGTGSMNLVLVFSGPDSDADVSNCGVLNPNFNPEKMDIVVQELGEHFLFAAQDDFLTASSDNGDLLNGTFKGSCTSQLKP